MNADVVDVINKDWNLTAEYIFGPSLSGFFRAVWPEKNRQMSIKVAQKRFHKKNKIFDTFKKLPKNVGDLGK